MIMNSNVVYGATVCHNGSTPSDYQNYHHSELAYYSSPTDLSSVSGATSAGSVVAGVTSTPAHYGPPLHMPSVAAHQFAEHTGIISENNGLSYTNLDTQGNYGTNSVSSHQRIGHWKMELEEGSRQNVVHSQANSQHSSSSTATGHSVTVSDGGGGSGGTNSGSGSVVSGSGGVGTHPVAHSSYTQYRDFTGESVTVPSGHPDMVSALNDCAVMRTVSAPPGSGQYTYLDPTLLSRRNGTMSHHHSALGAYTSDAPTFSDMSCGQLNGSPYHLNHLSSHLHHSPHHHHHHHHHHVSGTRTGVSGVSSVAAASPMPTYKWMQVKRNVPKPGKCNNLFLCFGDIRKVKRMKNRF